MMKAARYSGHRPTVNLKVPVSLDDKMEAIKEKLGPKHPGVSKIDLLDCLARNMEANMERWEKDLEQLLVVPEIKFGSRRSRSERKTFSLL